ncbi:WAT1-related protein [Platanthera zijinensis]|uniref:WAT1-related protein n=1 Tax=Platanthera zijinensis TaxID=2320716 RepID=A0AAP0G2M2_9ASPA
MVLSSSFEDVLVIAGLVAVEGLLGFYTIFLSRILELGLSPVFLVVAGTFVGGVFLIPFAVLLERKKWPAKITPAMVFQLVLISLGGVTMFQGLLLLGIKRTTPIVASITPNLIPGFVFIIAALLRLEKFSIRCKYSQAKVLGTIVCLGGAIAMSILQNRTSSSKHLLLPGESVNWIFGCLFLLAAIIIVSFIMVLQATTMVTFPAPFSICVITSLLGSFLTGSLQILVEGKIDVGTPDLSIFIIFLVVSESIISSACGVYQIWCMSKKGPLLVSIFSPIQTVSATVLSLMLFGQSIKLGSAIGMLFMVIGLYVFLWAKRKEHYEPVESSKIDAQNTPFDMENPLLS